MSARALLVVALCAIATHAQSAPSAARRLALRVLASEGCTGLPVPAHERTLLVANERAVDPHAHFWVLDRPNAYTRGAARREYRVGSGSIVVAARLSPDFSAETIELREGAPVPSDFARTYLGEFALPCERRVRYGVRALGEESVDLDATARADEALQAATEALYDDDFARSEKLLREASRLVPGDPAPWWMQARARYLALEQRTDLETRSARTAAYTEVERLADEAVRRAPDRAEGYLWRAIAAGRIATSTGYVTLALRGWSGGHGPAWLEATLRQAVSLPSEYRFFGASTRADALYALSQFYRLAPTGWAMRLVGTQGDIGRAVALVREAVELQPLRLEYRKELGVALLCRAGPGDRDAARAEFERALGLPAITRIDRIDHAHARALLAHGTREPCSYSRDAFAEPAT